MPFTTSLKNVWGSVRSVAHLARTHPTVAQRNIQISWPCVSRDIVEASCSSGSCDCICCLGRRVEVDWEADLITGYSTSDSESETESETALTASISCASSYSEFMWSPSPVELHQVDEPKAEECHTLSYNVYMGGTDRTFLLSYSVAPTWNELVAALAAKAQCSEKDVAVFHRASVGVMVDAQDYENWLEWAAETSVISSCLWMVAPGP